MILRLDFLQDFAAKLLSALGSPSELAAQIAESLVMSDACGRNSHGIAILPLYAEMIAANVIDPSSMPKIRMITESIINVDGCASFGQLTGQKSMQAGITAVRSNGAVVIGIRNGTHLGRLGEWAEQATSEGFVFMAFVNTSGGAKNVAAFGGHKRKLSTNPIAFGIPTFDALPFNIIADFATSQVSGSVIRERYRANIALHDEWTTTASGEPLKDAQAFMDGAGALLPLGGRVAGHKGFGLAVIAELLGGLVGGMVVGQHDPEWFSNSAMFILIDPCRFLSIAEIKDRIAAFAEHLHDDDQVRLPGEGAHYKTLKAQESGIEIPEYVLQSLAKLAVELAVEVPAQLSGLVPISTKGNVKSW
jgi:uncharacterized oxidoreductase